MNFSIRTTTAAAILGVAIAAAAAPVSAEPAKDTQYFLTAPGIGVVEDIGNSKAADVPMFHTDEQLQPHWIYDIERGVHVQRTTPADRTEAADFQGPELAFGLEVR